MTLGSNKMNDELYLRFENKFRGPRDVIKKLLAVYLPVVEPLKALYPESVVLDLGCGRGEWLELLKANGWRARGVDLNTGMLAFCKALDLEVEKEDAVQYVRKLPGESIAVITGFHIAEHLKFDDLVKLIQAAFQALIPGGMLILETPNPENIIVGTCNFYLDPTHRHQLPPRLMEFLAEESGFYKYRTLRLNSPLSNGTDTSFDGSLSQLFLAYPDYALVAQKMPAEKDVGLFALLEVIEQQNTSETRSLQQRMEELDWQLKQERQRIELALQSKEQELVDVRNGDELLRQQLFAAQQKAEVLSHQTGVLETELANQRGQAEQREQELAAAREYISTLETKVQLLQNESGAAKAKIDSLNHSCHHWWTVAEDRSCELKGLHASRSWRITKPLRWCGAQLRRLRLYAYLREGYLRLSEMHQPSAISAPVESSATSTPEKLPFAVKALLSQLSPRARQIYADLKAAFEKNKEAR